MLLNTRIPMLIENQQDALVNSFSPVQNVNNGAEFMFTNRLTSLPNSLLGLGATYTRNSLKHVLQYATARTNLALYSEGAAADWLVSNVVDGTTFFGADNALAFVDNSVQRYARKLVSITSGVSYTLSIFVIMDDSSEPVVGTSALIGDFRLQADSAIVTSPALVVPQGNGVYRVSASITASNTTTRFFGIYKETTQSSKGFRITKIQVETGTYATDYIKTTTQPVSVYTPSANLNLVSLQANQFGTSFDTDPLVMQYGYLPESAATNLLFNSGWIGASGAPTSWTVVTNGGTAVSADLAFNPYGKSITFTVAAAYNFILRDCSVSANTIYTASIHVSSVSGGLTAQEVINTNPALIPVGTTVSWPVCEANPSGGGTGVITAGQLLIQYTISGTAGSVQVRLGAGSGVTSVTGSVTLNCPQLEKGTYPSTWILTPAGATATRAADVLTVPLANVAGFNAAGYTMFVDGRHVVVSTTTAAFLELNAGTSANRAMLYTNPANAFATIVTSGGVSVVKTSPIATDTTRRKLGASIKLNSLLTSLNGLMAATEATSMSLPVSPNKLIIGSAGTLGYIYSAKLITTPITQSQLNAITT